MDVNRARVPESVRKQVAASQNWLCQACEHPLPSSFDVDHILGRTEGGSNDPSNLQALCCQCHRNKTVADAQRRARERAGEAQARNCRVSVSPALRQKLNQNCRSSWNGFSSLTPLRCCP